jgi:hypothetical protein
MNIFTDIIYKQGKDGRIFQLHWKYRFDPVSALLIGGAVAGAGGQVYSGMAANAEGKSAQNMANYNSQLAEREANMTEQRTALQQKQQAEEASRRQSTMRAGLGASGVVSTEGSPLLIQAEQASQDEFQNLLVGYQGQQEATALRSEATLQRQQGKMARKSGKNAMIGSFIGAGSSLMSGFGSAMTPANPDKALAAKHGISYSGNR